MLRYIVIEGLDFLGQSVLAEKLTSYYQAHLIKEPHEKLPYNHLITPLLESPIVSNRYKVQLNIANRIELFTEIAEKKYPTVISDGNYLSDMVCYGGDYDTMQEILDLNHEVMSIYHLSGFPDVLVYVDLPYDVVSSQPHVKLIGEEQYNRLKSHYNLAIGIMQHVYPDSLKVIRVNEKTTQSAITHQIDNYLFG